jgi:hypothetical protein
MLRGHANSLGFASFIVGLVLAFQPRPAQGQHPWSVLANFHSVGAGRLDNSAVVAILINPHAELLAVVVFPATCAAQDCLVSDPGAFVITDASGRLVRLHIEPGMEAICHPVFAAVLEGFTFA